MSIPLSYFAWINRSIFAAMCWHLIAISLLRKIYSFPSFARESAESVLRHQYEVRHGFVMILEAKSDSVNILSLNRQAQFLKRFVKKAD